MKEKNLAAFFQNRVYRFRDLPLFVLPVGEVRREMTWEEVGARVESIGRGLIALGAGQGERIAIIAENRPEWVIADLAIQSIGGVTVPIPPGSPPAGIASMLAASEVKIGFVDHPDEGRPLPALQTAVELDDSPTLSREGLLPMATLCKGGEVVPAADFYSRIEKTGEEDLSTILPLPVATSLRHREILSSSLRAASGYPVSAGDLSASFLPLNHPTKRSALLFSILSKGGAWAFPSKLSAGFSQLREIRPTILITLPGPLDEFHREIRLQVSERARPLRFLFERANRSDASSWARPIAESLFFNEIRSRLGGRLRSVLCAESLPEPDTVRFFNRIGVNIFSAFHAE